MRRFVTQNATLEEASMCTPALWQRQVKALVLPQRRKQDISSVEKPRVPHLLWNSSFARSPPPSSRTAYVVQAGLVALPVTSTWKRDNPERIDQHMLGVHHVIWPRLAKIGVDLGASCYRLLSSADAQLFLAIARMRTRCRKVCPGRVAPRGELVYTLVKSCEKMPSCSCLSSSLRSLAFGPFLLVQLRHAVNLNHNIHLRRR